MAKLGDAGVTGQGNYVKVGELIAANRVIEIVNAELKPAHGDFKEGVDFTFRYLDTDDGGKEWKFSQMANDVRRKYVEYFDKGVSGEGWQEPAEPLRGVKFERGIVLYKSDKGGQLGNKPVLFRDATEEEAATEYDGGDNGDNDEVPF